MNNNLRKLILSFNIISTIILMGCSSQKNEVIIGKDFLSKKLYYQAPMTAITHITTGDLNPEPGYEIGIFDQMGLHMLSMESNKLISKIKFGISSGLWKPAIISSDREGSYEIMIGDGVGDVGLMDHSGKVMWMFEPESSASINYMTVGDLDRDGISEFYVAANDGLYKLNHQGNILWHKGDWAYDVEVYDPGINQLPVIITINHDRYIQFWNSEGEVLRNIKLKVTAYDIEIIDWPTPGHILAKSDSSLFILDMSGNVVLEHKLSGFFSLEDYEIFMIHGTTVKFYDNQNPYLAVVTKFRSSSGKSMLNIFAPGGRLVYKELISVTTGVAAVRLPSSKSEILLVGDGPGKVNSYQIK